MHNASRIFGLWMLLTLAGWSADPPPPLVRSVLTTNLPALGSAGQAMFRTTALPYLNWSNLVWETLGTNALTLKLDSNWWWSAYGSKTLTNGGDFISSMNGFGTNTTTTNYTNYGNAIFLNGNVAIGTTNPEAYLHVGGYTNWVLSHDPGILVARYVDDTTGVGSSHGFVDEPLISRTGTGIGYSSFDARPMYIGTESYDHLVGFQSLPIYNSTGTLTNVYGLFHTLLLSNGAVANNFGFRLNKPVVGGGFITNNYGLYLEDMVVGNGQNYSVYGAGLAPARFGGDVYVDSKLAVGTTNTTMATMLVNGASIMGAIPSGGIAWLPLVGDTKLSLVTVTAPNIDKGAVMSMGGRYRIFDNSQVAYGSIAGLKENVTDSDLDGYLALYTSKTTLGGETERMRISSLGWVGINTNSPQARLHVVGENSTLNVVQVDTTNRHSLMRGTTNGNWFFSGTVTPTNGVVNQGAYCSFTNVVITSNMVQLFELNGTNQLVTLPDATKIPAYEVLRFSCTNGFGSVVITNATGGQTIRDGTSLDFKVSGVFSTAFYTDGTAWWLASKAKTIWPNASWSTSTNVPFAVATSNYITYDTLETSNGQGLSLSNGYQLYIRDAGQYMLTYSVVTTVGHNNDTNRIWLQQSAQNVPRTRTDVKLTSTAEQVVMTVNYIVPVVTNLTWFALVLRSTDTGAQLVTGAGASAIMPAMPSAIVTVNKISDTFP